MRTIAFNKLRVGARFEFAEKSKIAGGMYNGTAVKRSHDEYTMDGTFWITRRIGNLKIRIRPL